MPLSSPTCLVLACILSGQAAKTVAAQSAQRQRGVATTAIAQGRGAPRSGSNGPAIVIAGLCDRNTPTRGSNCKTVITQGQFEELIAATSPNMPKRARRDFAQEYADALVMVQKAEQLGLDRGTNFDEQMKLARVDILARALRKAVQASASQISEEEIEGYYKDNKAMFEKAEVDRLYIPEKSTAEAVSTSSFGNVGRQEAPKDLEERSRSEADTLHASAVSGVDFAVLQLKAYRSAGIESAPPDTKMWIRSISLPPNQRMTMDLRPGDVSPVLKDPNGYMIYRMVRKELLPLDQVHDQIKETLRSRRVQEQMQAIMNSATTTLNEAYFGR